MRLRPLSEAEAYARCYGDGDDNVRATRSPPANAPLRDTRSPASPCGRPSSSDSTGENPPSPRSAVASQQLPDTGALPDVLAPGLDVIFCGINPGRVSAAAGAHFANPRNDFWRLLHETGFTPRLLDPREQQELLGLGVGVTKTPRTGRPPAPATSAARLRRIRRAPRAGRDGAEAANDRLRRQGGLPRSCSESGPSSGCSARKLGETALFVLPSTSPANAAVPYPSDCAGSASWRSCSLLLQSVETALLDRLARLRLRRCRPGHCLGDGLGGLRGVVWSWRGRDGVSIALLEPHVVAELVLDLSARLAAAGAVFRCRRCHRFRPRRRSPPGGGRAQPEWPQGGSWTHRDTFPTKVDVSRANDS